MKQHTIQFKLQLINMGKQIDSIITYGQTTLHEELYAVTPHYEGGLLKSVMKQLDIETSVDIPLGTVVNYQLGLKVGNAYEYLDYGNYVVYKSEKKEDTDTYLITCYDKMLYSMKQNEDLGVTYPISIKDYLTALCTKIGLTFGTDEFYNDSLEIQNELYLDLDYTYRDILDEIAEATGSIICINSDDELEVRYLNDTYDIINENFLKDVNVKFGEKYGPINSVVLSRTAESDNVYLRDEESVQTNGLTEIKIIDNQIMNWNDRSDYLEGLLQALNGIEYYINDFNSPGLIYYDLGDYYYVQVGENLYKCLMLNDEINITQGIEEIVHTDMPEETETDYEKADKTDRRINQAYAIVDKQQQRIDMLVSEVGDRTTKTTSLTADVDGLTETVENIGDINSQFEEFKVSVEGAVNKLIENGGNNIFYYDTEFWTGEEVETPTYTEIQVGDDLSEKTLAFNFPEGVDLGTVGTLDIVTGNNGYSITVNQFTDISTGHFFQDILVKENGTNTRIYRYDSTEQEVIINYTELTLSDNFGTVNSVDTNIDAFEYITIKGTKTEEVLNIEEYTNTEFKNNSVSGRGYIVNKGSSKQDTAITKMAIQNGQYTISFKYRKTNVALATTKVKINGEEIILDKNQWTNFTKTIEVTTNQIEIQFISDTDNALFVVDLMGNVGSEANIWTQNPNETRTDTVKIGKGIEVSSSNTDTKLKADADGVRIVQASNENNVVAEFTDKGTETKELIVKGQAQISGLLFQQVENQVWISSLL